MRWQTKGRTRRPSRSTRRRSSPIQNSRFPTSTGAALAKDGKNEAAIPVYKKATELNPKDADAYYNWGASLADQGKNDEAIPLYRKATELYPKLALAYNNWGKALADQGKNLEAIPFFKKASELDPKRFASRTP